MTYRTLLLPAALVAALVFAGTPAADAAPRGAGAVARTPVVFGPRIHVGGHVAFPIGQRGGYYQDVVRYEGGYYVTRTQEVQVPGDLVGYDRHGRPIFSAPRTELQTHQVWVPARRVVERVWVPRRPIGHFGIGAGFRLR